VPDEMNWVVFFDDYFKNYSITHKSFQTGLYKIIFTNQTEIDIYLSEDGKILTDLVYWNEMSKYTANDFQIYLRNGEFSSANIETVQKILAVPIFQGWLEEQIYMFGKYYKSDVYSINNNEYETLHSSIQANIGCIRVIFFPIFIVFDLLIKIFKLGKRKRIQINPIMHSKVN
jgi:hypothetical protein